MLCHLGSSSSRSCIILAKYLRPLMMTASSRLVTTTTLPGAEIETAPTYPDGWQTAKRYSSIPGPGRIEMIRAFLPGGMYHNISIPEMQKRIYAKHGSLCRFPGMFGKPDMVFSFDPNEFKTVYRTEGVWPKRYSMEAFTYYRVNRRPDVFRGLGGLVTDQGATWHAMRTVVNPVMMSPKAARSYVRIVDEVTRDFVSKIAVMRNEQSAEMPATFGNELNLWALETIGAIALGRRLGVLEFERDADVDLLIQTVKDFFRLTYDMELKPAIWRYYETQDFKELMLVFDNMTRMVMGFVNEALENPSARSNGSVLQKLLRINRDYALLMTFDMLFAGIDTTSATSGILLYLLAKNPEAQERLRAEVFRVLPNRNAALRDNALVNTPYMHACIKESMRLQPIFSGVLRSAGQNLILNGYRIPKDTHIGMVTLSTDERYFHNSTVFRPERFLRDATGQRDPIDAFTFLPFGFGVRSCVGRRFAEMEMQILVTRILRDYRIEWHHGPMKYAHALVNAPISDLKFKFVSLK